MVRRTDRVRDREPQVSVAVKRNKQRSAQTSRARRRLLNLHGAVSSGTAARDELLVLPAWMLTSTSSVCMFQLNVPLVHMKFCKAGDDAFYQSLMERNAWMCHNRLDSCKLWQEQESLR